MILPVYVYGNAVLKKVAEEIEENYEGLSELIENMFDTMYKSDGVGLAAPQIGKSIRLFVIDGSPMAEDDESLKDFKKVFINPYIIEESGEKITYNEGCLSLPTIREDVERFSEITLEYQDENFKLIEEKFTGTQAWIIQHEYDHLEGTLFIDRTSPLRRKLLMGKLNAIKKGKVEMKYKVKLPK